MMTVVLTNAMISFVWVKMNEGLYLPSRRSSDAMQCNAMQCNAMQCNAMQCNAMPCHAMPLNAVTLSLRKASRTLKQQAWWQYELLHQAAHVSSQRKGTCGKRKLAIWQMLPAGAWRRAFAQIPSMTSSASPTMDSMPCGLPKSQHTMSICPPGPCCKACNIT